MDCNDMYQPPMSVFQSLSLIWIEAFVRHWRIVGQKSVILSLFKRHKDFADAGFYDKWQ